MSRDPLTPHRFSCLSALSHPKAWPHGPLPSVLATLLLACLGWLMILPTAMAKTVPDEVGVWIDDSGNGAVEIALCGTRLCGRIVWLKNPKNAKGQPLHDIYNPNPKKRGTPICGLRVVWDLQRQADRSWDVGQVYDPKTGSTYNVEVRLMGRDQLQVTGYLGMKMFGKSFLWRRAPPELSLCTAIVPPRPELCVTRKSYCKSLQTKSPLVRPTARKEVP